MLQTKKQLKSIKEAAITPKTGAAGIGIYPHGIKKIYPSSAKIPDWYMLDLNAIHE
jgi:hypothetical protein